MNVCTKFNHNPSKVEDQLTDRQTAMPSARPKFITQRVMINVACLVRIRWFTMTRLLTPSRYFCWVRTSKRLAVSHGLKVQPAGSPHRAGSTMVSEVCVRVWTAHRLQRAGKAADSCCGSPSEAELSISPSSACLWGDPPLTPPSPLIHLFSLSFSCLSIAPSLTPAHTHMLPHYRLSEGICHSPSYLHLPSFSLWATSVTLTMSFTLFFSVALFSICFSLSTADFNIHNRCYSFDFSSLTLLISIWAPSFSLSLCFSLCLSPLLRWSGW